MFNDKLTINVSKKGSTEVIARIFRDEEGEVKAIVDDEYDVDINHTKPILVTKDELEIALMEWLDENQRAGDVASITIYPQVARVLLDSINTKESAAANDAQPIDYDLLAQSIEKALNNHSIFAREV